MITPHHGHNACCNGARPTTHLLEIASKPSSAGTATHDKRPTNCAGRRTLKHQWARGPQTQGGWNEGENINAPAKTGWTSAKGAPFKGPAWPALLKLLKSNCHHWVTSFMTSCDNFHMCASEQLRCALNTNVEL